MEELNYLCRLCATKMGILMGLPIFEGGEQMRNIDKKIAACLPVQVCLIICEMLICILSLIFYGIHYYFRYQCLINCQK